MMELETRVALLERSEEFYKKLSDDANESRKKVWETLNQLRTDFLEFKGEIRNEFTKDITKLWIKIAGINAGLSIIISLIVGAILKIIFG